MKVSSFFKILNKKIEQYDKFTHNPFTKTRPVIIVWVEDDSKNDLKNNKNFD